MKNYVMTKNYKKVFRRLIICFVIFATMSSDELKKQVTIKEIYLS